MTIEQYFICIFSSSSKNSLEVVLCIKQLVLLFRRQSLSWVRVHCMMSPNNSCEEHYLHVTNTTSFVFVFKKAILSLLKHWRSLWNICKDDFEVFCKIKAVFYEMQGQRSLTKCQLEFRAFAKSKKDDSSSYEIRLINKSLATFVSFRMLFYEEN